MATVSRVKTTREEKARLLYDGGVRPVALSDSVWEIHSARRPESYLVQKWGGDNWECSCPDHVNRLAVCKHILLTQMCYEQHEVKTCETCGRAKNRSAPYLWCDFERAFKAHNAMACGHWTAHEQKQSQEAELIVVC